MMELSQKIENSHICEKKRAPEEEIRSKNPWYVSDQFESAQNHAKPTIQRRYDFISRSIERYIKDSKKRRIRVLDAGCGDGIQLQGLLVNPALDVWGIDYNPIRTRRALQRFRNVEVICGDLIYAPFKPGVFDIILCSQVIEHISRDEVLLSELARALRPNGLLILGTPNEGCLMARLRNHIFQRRIMKITDHFHFYREQIIRQKIEAAGFSINEVMRENWFFPHQRINYYLTNRSWGFRIMERLNKIIPSQTGGYYFRCAKWQ